MTNTNNYHHNNPGDPTTTTTTTTTTTLATTNLCLLPAAEPQPPQRPRSAREEVAHTVSAMISFHCIICFDEFNTTTRTPMVLPCGHTYVCLPCTKRLKRCMECRQSLFLPNNNHPNNNNNNQNQNNNNNNNNNHPFDQNSSYPFSNSRAQFRNHNNNNATNNPSGGVRGGGFPNRRYYGVGQPPPPPQPAQPSEPIPLPIPKNVVLLSMIEATLEQQSRWKPPPPPPPQESPDHHHHHTATRKILRGGGGGGVGDSSSPPPHHHHKRTSSVPQEVELTIGGGIQGPNGEDEDLSANSSASDQEVLSTGTHPEDEQDHDENDGDGDGGHNENSRSSRNIAKEEEVEEEEEEDESFQMDRIVKSIETLLAGSCGTYAVREKEGLVVLPKDPRKNRQQLQERLQQEHEKLRRQEQQQQQQRRHHHDSSSGALSSCSSSGQSSSEAASSSLNRFGAAAGVGGGSGSTTAKDLASLRLRKRQLEHRILHQRRSSSSSSSLESLTKSSSYYCSPKLGAAAAAAGTARDDHHSVNSASPEEEESRCSNSIAKKRTSPPSLPAPRAHARVDSNSSIISIRKRLHDVRMKNNKLIIMLGESPEQHQQQVQQGQEHPKQEQSRGRSPPVTKNRRSSHGHTSPSSMSNLTLSPASSSNVARPKSSVVTATLKEPFRIKYGQKVQAVSFVDGVVTLARNQGFILATPSQLVKVGPPADDSCRLEGLLETVSLEGRELEAKLKTNHSICLALMKKIQMAQAAPAKHPIVTELSRESPEGSTTATATPDQAGPKGRDDPHSHHDGATVVDDSNSLMQTGSVDPTDTGPAPAPKTPPTQLMQPSLRTPTAPNRAHPTTSIGEPCRGYRGGLTSSSSTNSSHGSSRVPDTPKTIDNSDLDHQHVRRRQNNRRSSGGGGGGGILGLAQSLSRASTNPRSNRRSTSVTESDHMDLIFGCGTSLLSTTECLSHAADDPVSRDLFLPSPRSTGGSMYHDEDDDEDGNNNNNNNNNDENGTTQTPHPYQPQQQQHPTTPSTPRSPAILASSAGRYIRTPESVASTSTLTPVLQPISSFDSAINFRTGFSGHNGLTVTSIKKNKVYHSPPLSAHNQPQLGYGHHSYGTSQQQQQQHQLQLQHSQQQQQQQRRPRIRMMGEHRGLGLRLDVRQAMSSWGITTSQNTS